MIPQSLVELHAGPDGVARCRTWPRSTPSPMHLGARSADTERAWSPAGLAAASERRQTAGGTTLD